MDISRVRFSLAKLLVVVTVTALFCWGYWHLLPEFREYQRKSDLEAGLRSLKAGPNRNRGISQVLMSLSERIGPGTLANYHPYVFGNDAESVTVLHESYGTYCVLIRVSSSNPYEVWSVVRVFRFPPIPPGHKESQYLTKCSEIAFGHAVSDVNFDFEIIHSDSAAKKR